MSPNSAMVTIATLALVATPLSSTIATVHGAETFAADPLADLGQYEVEDLPYWSKAPPSCPPPGLTSVPDLNLTAYVEGRWYIQEQMPIRNLEADSVYCVTAKYEITEPPSGFLKVFASFFDYYRTGEIQVNVFNYANKNAVNGEVQIGNLKAAVPRPNTNPAQLEVGPGFLPRFLWGPYWVVAAGPGPDKYTWAIVSGGPPTEMGGDGYCTTEDGTYNSGFWLFTREQIASPERVNALRDIAKGLGYDTNVLLPVNQEGCLYDRVQN